MNISNTVRFLRNFLTPLKQKSLPTSSNKSAPQIYPKVSSAEHDGWKVTIDYVGVFSEFVFATAQQGDPKGIVTLTYKGQSFSLGDSKGRCSCCNRIVPTLPINIVWGGLSDSLVFGFINEHNSIRPDRRLICDLLIQARAPYIS
jgi:hypothetical protein